MSESLLDHAAIADRTHQAYKAHGYRTPAQIFDAARDDHTDDAFEFVRANRISFDWLVDGNPITQTHCKARD